MCSRTIITLTASGRWRRWGERTGQRTCCDSAGVGIPQRKHSSTATSIRCDFAFAFPVVRYEPHLESVDQTRTITGLNCSRASRSRQVASKRWAGSITCRRRSRRRDEIRRRTDIAVSSSGSRFINAHGRRSSYRGCLRRERTPTRRSDTFRCAGPRAGSIGLPTPRPLPWRRTLCQFAPSLPRTPCTQP